MTSNVINMADRKTDMQDEFLTKLFASAPIADDGFSRRVMRRVRRQVWIDRLALPVACVLGLLVAFKPLLQVSKVFPSLVEVLPLDSVALDTLPAINPQMIVFGGLLLFALLFVLQVVED